MSGYADSNNRVERGVFKIESKHAKKALDICQDQGDFGICKLYDYYGGENQKFKMFQSTEGYSFQSLKSSKFLSVEACSSKDGACVIEQAWGDLPGQYFHVEQSADGFVLGTFCGKALDCCEEQTSNGTAIIQYAKHGKVNQQFTMTPV